MSILVGQRLSSFLWLSMQVPSTLLLYHFLGPQGPLNSVGGEIEGEESILAS